MFGTRQSLHRPWGRSILALSTLALLAFVCLPGLAFGSGAGYQYQDAPPTATGKPPSESDHDGGPQPTQGVGPAGKSNSTGDDSTGKKSSDDGSGGAATKGGGGSGGGGNAQQGSQAKDGKAGTPSAKPAGSAEPGSDGGDSSPLGPILVGIAILAGCSIAYVMYRRRQAGESDSPDSSDSPGSSPSPEAS